MHMRYQTRYQALIVLLVVALLMGLSPVVWQPPVYAYEDPFDNQAVLLRGAWLNSYGVEVYYNFHYKPNTRFTALDLPIRLYEKQLGYPANWNVSSPQEIKTLVETGFEDLVFYPNGGNMAPQMGDILLWDNHVAVVDVITDNIVNIVQQNVWSSYDDAGIPVARSATTLLTTTNEIYSIVGAIGWVRSPYMQDLLLGKLRPIGIAGDWNGDGIDTIGFYHPATSDVYLRNNNYQGPPDYHFRFGEPRQGWTPIVGDWDGDGIDTIGAYNLLDSTYHLKNSNTDGEADLVFRYGNPGDFYWMPCAGDWDNNNTDTIGIYNQGTRTAYLKTHNATDGPRYIFYYGPKQNNWIPIAGDWNGDGMDSTGFYNPDISEFMLKNEHNTDPAEIVVTYGSPVFTWWPLAGDWNGDGIDTIGLYTFESLSSPEKHLFLLNNSNSSQGLTTFVHFYVQYVTWFPYWAFGSVQ